jgi:hypothetical protein
VSQLSNTREGKYSAVVTAGFFQSCIAFECNGIHFEGFYFTLPSEFYVLCRFAKVYVIYLRSNV